MTILAGGDCRIIGEELNDERGSSIHKDNQEPFDEKQQDATIASSSSKKNRSYSRVKNQHKTKYFINWLLQTFPQLHVPRTQSQDIQPDGTLHRQPTETPLESTPLVIDIAGGKGELAARLIVCQRLRVVMIDPRESDVPLCFEKTVLPKLPAVWRCRFQRRQQEDAHILEKTFQERFHQYQMYFQDDTAATHPEVGALIEKAALLVGMHADGATEAIVDTALRYKKPFCVVPCCVFPTLFHTRTIRVRDEEGNEREVPVRSYEQFCQYLMNKHPRIQQSILPFDGRNVAIWWDGTS
jgi:hypothetical protein